MRMHQNLPFFMEKTGKKWPLFGEKLCFFGLSQAVEDLPTLILGVLDAKKHVVWGHRSPKHNLQHANYLNGCFFFCCRFWDFWTS